MKLPVDYEERVYAGILGKIFGIYFGQTMEAFPYEKVVARFGDFTGYTHRDLNNKLRCMMALANTSDDINIMFASIRALSDNENRKDISAADIGRTWLNNFIFERTATWWGGMCFSSEYSAMVRLMSGVEAPRSGSIELNGKVTAQQIGGRIFVDAWPMVAPGDAELAADLSRKAASVSHDGESIYGAQVVAVMEAMAFVNSNLDELFDEAIKHIPKDSIIYESTQAVREWHAKDGDWKRTNERIYETYGYDKFGGGCHIVPNHALTVLGLVYGESDFRKSMVITATAGLDTDCNCSAVGCILGIKDGLAAYDGCPDLRFPVEDRLFTSTADTGRSITDAVIETYHIVNIGRAIAGKAPNEPKNGARFHFELPGSVQCFRPELGGDNASQIELRNIAGHSEDGKRSLALRYCDLGPETRARFSTATFATPEALSAMSLANRRLGGWKYRLVGSPTLYSGQTVRARVSADVENEGPVSCALYLRDYQEQDLLQRTSSPDVTLEPGQSHTFNWLIPDTEGRPIGEIGVEISATKPALGCLYLDYLTWDGSPNIVLRKPERHDLAWRNAWTSSVDGPTRYNACFNLRHGVGKGLLIQGAREWKDYAVSAALCSNWAINFGLAARVQGVRRYYALLLGGDQKLRLIKMLDTETVLAEVDFPWEERIEYALRLEVQGGQLTGSINGKQLINATDTVRPLHGGGIALVLEEGQLQTDAIAVSPVDVTVPLQDYRRADCAIEYLPRRRFDEVNAGSSV